jgi:RHS repeat-associated protein
VPEDYYYHADDLYNVMAVTDAAGDPAERYEYADYGRPEFFDASGTPIPASAIANPYLFTGREYDAETGWYYYRTRYLDPVAGRFTVRDTIGIWGDQANIGNASGYVANSTYSTVDPFGLGGLTDAEYITYLARHYEELELALQVECSCVAQGIGSQLRNVLDICTKMEDTQQSILQARERIAAAAAAAAAAARTAAARTAVTAAIAAARAAAARAAATLAARLPHVAAGAAGWFAGTSLGKMEIIPAGVVSEAPQTFGDILASGLQGLFSE